MAGTGEMAGGLLALVVVEEVKTGDTAAARTAAVAQAPEAESEASKATAAVNAKEAEEMEAAAELTAQTLGRCH